MKANTILCPTDFSSTAERAFELASALASESGATLVVLHVMKPPLAFDGEIRGDAIFNAAEVMEALKRVCPTQPNMHYVHSLQWGDPARTIVRTAENQHADMIVMGTHGRTGIRRLLVGSVAEQVMRRAPCPVLTVRQPAAVEVLEVA